MKIKMKIKPIRIPKNIAVPNIWHVASYDSAYNAFDFYFFYDSIGDSIGNSVYNNVHASIRRTLDENTNENIN